MSDNFPWDFLEAIESEDDMDEQHPCVEGSPEPEDTKSSESEESDPGRHSWILKAFGRAAAASSKVVALADAKPVTVLTLERYLKDIASKTRIHESSASGVFTRASFSLDVSTSKVPTPTFPSSKAPTLAPSSSEVSIPDTNQAPVPGPSSWKEPTSASSITKSPKRSAYQYLYDVTISDGVYQEKCLLAPGLSRLVHRNTLRCGMKVKITEASCAFVEKFGRWVLCIEQLELLSAAHLGVAAEDHDLPQYENKAPMPLKGRWKHYLSLWNNEDPYGDIWQGEKFSMHAFVDEPRVKSLLELQMDFGCKIGRNMQTGYYPLIVKITHRGKLDFYGKAQITSELPYKASFKVADRSGFMTMVLWDDLCPEWYNTLEPGTVLLLENYGVKRSRPFKRQQTTTAIGTKKLFSIELSLKAGETPAVITIIPKDKVKAEWRLPKINYHFITRLKLDISPYANDCDIVGLVTYVGRTERTRKQEHGEAFWIHRWVHVADGTSDQPFIIKLYSTSQPSIFETIHPMSPLVCTHMRRTEEDDSDTIYLTTSNESQVFISEWHIGQLYEDEWKVRRVAQWMITQEESSQMEKASIGGYYPFPPVPNNFLGYCKGAKADSVLKTVSEIAVEIRKLHYRERKRIAIEGIIGAVKYVDCSNESPDTPEQTDQQSPTESSLEMSQPTAQEPAEPREHQVKRKIWDMGSDDDMEDVSEVQEQPRKKTAKKKHGATGRYQPGSWESYLWTAIKGTLKEHLLCSRVFPESFPSKFNFRTGEFLMQQYNLQKARCGLDAVVPPKEFSIEYACPHEYYQVTIIGVDSDSAIDVALLPVCYSENAHLLQAVGMQRFTEELPYTSCDEEELYGDALGEKHVICILDVCCLGEDNVEVFLNKVYTTTK